MVAHAAVGQREAREAARQPAVDEVLNPGVVGVADGRIAEGETFVAAEDWAGVVGDIERRVGEDEVGLEVGMLRAE